MLFGSGLFVAGCAARLRPALPGVPEQARLTSSYSARVRVSLKGPSLRARVWTLVAFERPDRIRIEASGPAGAQLVAVARDGLLSVVFPRDRGFYQGPASPDVLEYLLGVGLAPHEFIDLLMGIEPSGLRDYAVGWGPQVPERIRARLRDDAKLELVIENPMPEAELSAAAFEPPPHPGYRPLSLEEARGLWGRR